MNCVANIYKKNSSSSSTTLYLSASYIFLCHFFCCCFVFCHQTHHKYLDGASKCISIVRCKMMKWSGIQLRWLHKSITNCEINQLSEFHSFLFDSKWKCTYSLDFQTFIWWNVVGLLQTVHGTTQHNFLWYVCFSLRFQNQNKTPLDHSISVFAHTDTHSISFFLL